MQYEIKRYPVHHPLLKNYIKFFWEINANYMQLCHKITPQRNINLRFNLSETPQYACIENEDSLLEEVSFSGLQDSFRNIQLKSEGCVKTFGISFQPYGFYPFFKIPVSEFKNQLLGGNEIGFKATNEINERLKEASNSTERLMIVENELIKRLDDNLMPKGFEHIFNRLQSSGEKRKITDLCEQNNLGIRQLERMYNKYVGISAMTYITLHRFHQSTSQLLSGHYTKLSDIAYDNGYYDQMHFIKDFKRFTGKAPQEFINQNGSMLQIGKFT